VLLAARRKDMCSFLRAVFAPRAMPIYRTVPRSLAPRWYTARNDEAPSKAVAGAFAMMAAMTAGVVACAETNILPWASFGSKIGPARKAELFVCSSPFHHDGDAIRCGDHGRSDRLYAIDAPECPERVVLARLHAGRSDRRAGSSARFDGRKIGPVPAGRYRPLQTAGLQYFADGIDLSGAMAPDGFAVACPARRS